MSRTKKLDPVTYYERTKLHKFKHSSRLEGIVIDPENVKSTLEEVLEKHRKTNT